MAINRIKEQARIRKAMRNPMISEQWGCAIEDANLRTLKRRLRAAEKLLWLTDDLMHSIGSQLQERERNG